MLRNKKNGVKMLMHVSPRGRDLRGSLLLTAALLITGLVVAAPVSTQAQQTIAPGMFHGAKVDLAVTYDLERAKIADTGSDNFWLQGGSAEGGITFYRGLSVVANVTGEHASGITPGVDLSKLVFLAGPRYTFNTTRYSGHLAQKHGTQLFGEFLVGGAHGFDSIFPANNAATTSASSFAMQLGGGADIALAKGFGLRLIEVDYVRTSLPNNGSNTQDDLRIAFGGTYHFGKR
jgi:hypothetical protein